LQSVYAAVGVVGAPIPAAQVHLRRLGRSDTPCSHQLFDGLPRPARSTTVRRGRARGAAAERCQQGRRSSAPTSHLLHPVERAPLVCTFPRYCRFPRL